jgi:hypothetical protein
MILAAVGLVGVLWYVGSGIGKKGGGTQSSPVTYENYFWLSNDDTAMRTMVMTRAEFEAKFGPGRALTADELARVLAGERDEQRESQKWAAKIEQGRAFVWQNGNDYLLAAFHPDAAATSRLQVCHFVGGAGIPKLHGPDDRRKTVLHWVGTIDDVQFLRQHPLRKPGSNTGPVEVYAETLARDFQANLDAAAQKYTNLTVVVEGKLDMITDRGDMIIATLGGIPRPNSLIGFNIWCGMKPGAETGLFRVSVGQAVCLRGKCVGSNDFFVHVVDCEFERAGRETAVATTAAALLSDYARSEKIADPVYKDKQVVVRRCRVVSVDPEGLLYLESMLAKPPAVKLRASCTRDLRARFTTVKPGDVVTIRGECAGVLVNEVSMRICSPPEVEPAGPPPPRSSSRRTPTARRRPTRSTRGSGCGSRGRWTA